MKYFGLVFLTGFLLVGFNVSAQDGKAVFETLRCGGCHRADKGSANPPLKEIARMYKGKESQLLNYLNGEADSIVNPEKGDRMKRYIEKTKALKDEERKALSEYILSHGD
ncbi:MAG: c-type cytochrome [Pseudomonadota bacterium]